MRIFLVEDDPDLAQGIKHALTLNAHTVDWVADGAEADALLATESFDAMVLDLNLPGRDGIDILKRLRQRGSLLPVLVVTARAALEDRLAGLDEGADDYLVKPFALTELEARLRALMRRSQGVARSVVRLGRLSLDSAARQILIDDEPIELPRREFELIELLIARLGRVVGKEQIAEHVFGFDSDAGPNAIELYVHRLRRRLAGTGVVIRTVRGLGYLLEAP